MQRNKFKLVRLFPLCQVLALALGCLVGGSALSASSDQSSKFIEYLAQEKISLNQAIQSIKIVAPTNKTNYQDLTKENQARTALNQAKIVSLEGFLVNQKKLQQDYIIQLKRLQQKSAGQSGSISYQKNIDKLITLNDINKKAQELINEDMFLANQYQERLFQQKQQLSLWKSKIAVHERINQLRVEEHKFERSLEKLFDHSLELQQSLKDTHSFTSTYVTEAKLLLNNQAISLTQYKIAELNLQRELLKADFLLESEPDIRTLQKVTLIYKDTINQLSDMEQALKNMISVLKSEKLHIQDAKLNQQFGALIRIINTRIAGISIQEQTLQEDLENHQLELKKRFSVRQSLSDYKLNSWPQILQQITRIPMQFYNYNKVLLLKVRDNYLWQDTLPVIIVWSMLILTLFAFIGLHRLLKRLNQNTERARLTGYLYYGLLTIIDRNLPHLMLVGLLWVMFYFNHVPFASYQLLAGILSVWISFRTLILIARISLMERVSDASGKDVRLYHHIKWLLTAGGWATALMVFGNQLPLSSMLQDIFNRLFMLFLVAIAAVIWKSREGICDILDPLIENKKRYFKHVIILLTVLIPLTLITTAVIGLIGYVNLSWSLGRYQAIILSVITAYILMRGLLFDALELLSEWMISKLRNGWLWIEVFLKPVDTIGRAVLIILSGYVLFQLFGWHSKSLVVVKLKKFIQYPLVDISGIHITSISILKFTILSSVFIWLSKWTREFSYRWLFRDARDAGIRNSLSVFAQYSVILVGGFISFRILGLDFSGMSMILGGLAVGMGFGLRDFASNIVGGIMLLIERPVREGDLITLGTHEGRVAHIGIRSMRVSTWDNTEVLIPNAETFNKPFTNWTHQDGIVRTVIPIKVSRSDDPALVQQLIFDVLAVIPEIVTAPAPQVFLKQIDDALIEFEIRYFINVQIHTRFEIRSKVLFAIIAQFKAAGIKAPIPPINVEINKQNAVTETPTND